MRRLKELKKIGACIMTFAMAAVLFAGCGGGQADVDFINCQMIVF